MVPLPFPTIVAASRDDPYVAFERAIDMAKAWGAELVDIGEAGHINAGAGYGEWPEGEQLLQQLQAGKPAYHSA
jgi:predicted alpha/beta hydrolase family esterase